MSAARDLTVGLANLIASAGIAVFDPAGNYQPGDTGIVMKNVPASPDRVVTLTWVPQTDSPNLPMGSGMMQVRVRGIPSDPLDADDLGDTIFDAIHGLTNLMFGSQHVVQILRESSVPMGQDTQKRWDRADGYHLDIDTPPTVTRPATGN